MGRFSDRGPGLLRAAAFLALAAEFPARFRIIDGNRGIDAVASDIRAATASVLG